MYRARAGGSHQTCSGFCLWILSGRTRRIHDVKMNWPSARGHLKTVTHRELIKRRHTNGSQPAESGPLHLVRMQRSALVWKRRIKERKCVRRLDHPSPLTSLLLRNLLMQLLHFCPVQFWTKMMLRVIPVVKPERIIDFFVRTHTPGNRFVWVPAIVQVIAVQVGQAMPYVIERQEEQDKFPVQESP